MKLQYILSDEIPGYSANLTTQTEIVEAMQLVQLYAACLAQSPVSIEDDLGADVGASDSHTELSPLNGFDPTSSKSKTRTKTSQVPRRPTSSLGARQTSALKLPENAWDDFYTAHGEKFFKDRHYLQAEHRTLSDRLARPDTTVRILDLGCGVGNSILPLLDVAQAKIEYLGVDVSPKAVEILQSKLESYEHKHVGMVEVLDVVNCTDEQWNAIVQRFFDKTQSGVGFEFCLMIFSVSAFPPEKMGLSIRRTCKTLQPGVGVACFRDYLRGDLAEERFPKGQKLGRGLYVRQDGTLSFFFTPAGLQMLFEDTECMRTLWIKRVIRTVENRAYELRMNRSWIGAEFLRT